ncbi:MAG: YgjV family protein [Firmicutes bacterium]|nr:YgjV family protein [Bacillota bacterium]
MPSLLEWLGYVASLIVLISLLMSSVKRLRWINLGGSLLFAVYGYLIGALPVGIMNTGIVLINIYYLYQMYAKKDYFKLLPIKDNIYYNHFMNSHITDMRSFMDIENHLEEEKYEKIFILRNTVPAGVVVGIAKDSQTFEILIDYVTPAYRDFKIGNFLYEDQKDYFLSQGYHTLITKPGNLKHQKYLKKMGFSGKDSEYFVKDIGKVNS